MPGISRILSLTFSFGSMLLFESIIAASSLYIILFLVVKCVKKTRHTSDKKKALVWRHYLKIDFCFACLFISSIIKFFHTIYFIAKIHGIATFDIQSGNLGIAANCFRVAAIILLAFNLRLFTLSDFDIKTPTVKASAFKYVKEKRRQNKNKKGEGK